jgi:radical SAM enzyme (TIGR01210 family)
MSNKHYIIPIFVPHEGCPHECVFCNQNIITGSSNNVNAEFVSKTVNDYLSTINKRKENDSTIIEISFFGGTFTAIPMEKQNELLKEAKKFKDLGKIKFIRLSTRPDYIDDDILSNLKKHSVDIIELGVQSLDEDVLFMSGRGHSAQDVIDASKLIKQYGFTLGHQFMLGLPGDNFKKDIETVKKAIQLAPDLCRIYPALIVKNTQMEKMYEDGQYNPYTLEEAVDICKTIYSMLINNHIEVIRVGLQPTEEINTDAEVVDGPFHPSFRELVEGSFYNDMIYDKIKACNGKIINLYINNRDISKIYTNRKKYFNEMVSKLHNVKINVLQDKDIERGKVVIEIGDFSEIASLREYTSKNYNDSM